MRLHHVQVACPPGGEVGARRFYGEGLGMTEVEKPAELAKRGGCWFRAYDDRGETAAEIHVGVEDPFVAAKKAHPALLLDTIDELEDVGARLQALGFDVDWNERGTFAGHLRFHTRDAHGNRVEVLTPAH
ncbi:MULTISPECIES: VOC family protein [unclassified Nocardioides]|uniref:VOC family protein n=1 Tax=unclassified Nocardioides TaxID=2615069 RepID=UPI0006F85123|nr:MULTISPECIES: VOC family protein [unclassified Nocardioides]KQY56756.1 glyoxalase [Nocardioides sp. Root140]KRF12877.1 glyoxalase [Nocardioides sp. Soil796]